ncbi:TPA: hypothetical protein ACN343_002165 [Vibrio parahaemolyticus]|nr:hypothetical protein [Vibrio parahaemolyticus]EJG1205989.1 hypothetical protein [Vibrio parahaemolyticus]ELB1647890.1 hypothetical protein [Vibrio parahaemolyticus]ELU1679000.1 hypothetical protein [Vibrio parahaemolyticus]MDF4292161.1 hypothetical protein [Vibrio parahaemolyticus]MDG2587171.1 hypothetical protein [Vibrio parahaemolyticus]
MKKKKSKFAAHPPVASDINEANALIEELWGLCFLNQGTNSLTNDLIS